MTHNKTKAALVGLAAVVTAAAGITAAHAQTVTRGLYVGGAIGQSEAKEYNCTTRAQCENRGTVGKFFTGFQFHRNFALELGLTDLGQVSSSNPGTFEQTVKVRLGELELLASYPVTDRFMVYAKGGGYYAQSTNSETVSGVSTRTKETNGGVTWAGGLQYFVTGSIGLRGEFQRYMKVGGGNIGDSDYNAFTFGVLWKIR